MPKPEIPDDVPDGLEDEYKELVNRLLAMKAVQEDTDATSNK